MDKKAGEVKIRPMEPEDISSILEVDHRISGKRRAVTYTGLTTGDLGGDPDLSFVAEEDGQFAGFILARRAYFGEPVAETGLIQILGVDPDRRGRGIATALVNAVLERCRAAGIKQVRISVRERDSQLQSFFTHVGFRRGQYVDYVRTP